MSKQVSTMSIRHVPITCPPRGKPGTLHGPAIALKPSVAAAARTGGFFKLDQAALDAMERDNVLDPISMERPIHQSTFRVQMRTPNADGTPRYSHWDPEELWNWVRRPESQGRMPDNREKIWYEDWWALYYTYGPAPIVPEWARTLDKREAATQPAGNVGGGSFCGRRRPLWRRRRRRPLWQWQRASPAPSSNATPAVTARRRPQQRRGGGGVGRIHGGDGDSANSAAAAHESDSDLVQ